MANISFNPQQQQQNISFFQPPGFEAGGTPGAFFPPQLTPQFMPQTGGIMPGLSPGLSPNAVFQFQGPFESQFPPKFAQVNFGPTNFAQGVGALTQKARLILKNWRSLNSINSRNRPCFLNLDWMPAK
jgi:hypothetical protein